MGNTSGGSPSDEAAGSKVSQKVIDTPRLGLRPHQRANLPSLRRSTRNTPKNTSWGGREPFVRLENEAPGPSVKKQKVVTTEEAPRGMTKVIKIAASASPTSRDPNTSSSSKDGAKVLRSDHGMAANVRSSSNKRKYMQSRDYIALFKQSNKVKVTDIAVKSSKQLSVRAKTKKVKGSPFQKLQKLPDGCHPDFDTDHLYSVNRLLEFWHKSQGAVFVDDKERVMKTILFITSVLPDVCQPFLVVTTASLSLWKAEFNRFAPFINVVVYDGDKDVRKSIQDLEFNENGRNKKLHVLLAHPDAILEEIENAQHIIWEAVVVDYCQNSVLNPLKQLKQLSTDFRILLLSFPTKDNLLEYKNLLAFLNSEEEDNGDHLDDYALLMLRARFTRRIAYERKADSSKFSEYWVPAYLSQVQLQLYSSILVTNSSAMQPQIETDNAGALRDIILCLWKCCDHPCLIDEFPQNSPVNIDDATELMRASGKLLLLEKMLQEIRNKRLRVIVFFQSDGAGGNKMGKILEGFVSHRFGPESYVRVQNRSTFSTRQEAISMFNDMSKGRFVFLIESHACHSSIHLSSVDVVIIYGSDRNPLNDLKAIGKIKIESQLEYVSIFRLYTPFTVEEKGLVLAKEGMIVDSNIQDIVPSLSHCFLSWGVSFLFNRLDELQQDNPADISSERGSVYMDNVISEFLTELSTNLEDRTKVNSTTISKAYMSGEFYSRNITLIGERERVSSLDGDHSRFWLHLLDGRSPCLYHMSEPLQVKHRNLQNMVKPVNGPAEETNGTIRKCRKTGEIVGSSSNISSDVSNNDIFTDISPSGADLQLLGDTQQESGVEILSTPKSLHVQLKCELSKLIKVLELPDNVCFLAEQFLEYLLKNHLVVQEPQSILHALNIALCWRAASYLKYKLDRKKSLALAGNCLNYECNEDLTGQFYEKLGTLKEKVLHKAVERSNKIRSDRFSSQESLSTYLKNDHIFSKHGMDCWGSLKNSAPKENSSGANQMVSDGQEVSAPEADRQWHLSSKDRHNMIIKKRIDLFDHVSSLREKNIHEKQQLEILALQTHRENQVIKLKKVCSLVLDHIRSGTDEDTRNDQISLIIQWFTMLVFAFLEHMRLQLDKLKALQTTTWFEERLMKEKLRQEAISDQLDRSLDPCIDLPDSNFVIEEFIHFKKQNDDYHVCEILASGCDQLLDDKLIMETTMVQNTVPLEATSICSVRNEPAESLVGCSGAAASESVYIPENSILCSSDGIGLQGDCCSNDIPSIHDSINQESSTDECRNIEHPKKDNIANPSMLLGGATSLNVGVNANNDGSVEADPVHLESPIFSSPQSLATMSVSREAGIEANLSNMSAPHTVGTLQHPPAEAEQTDTLHAMAAQTLQTEMQTSCSTMDVQPQRMRSDDLSKMSLEPDTATVLFEKGMNSHHLGDASVRDKNVDAAADPLNSEKQSYIAPHNPASPPDSWEVETQTDQLGMPAQSTSLPSQQRLATSGHPLPEAEPSSNLDTEAARNLQPDIQPSSSMLDADSCQTGSQPETTPDPSQGGGAQHHLVDARMEVNANDNDTDCPHQAHSESPNFAAAQNPAMLSFSSGGGTRATLSSMSSEQSTDAPPRHPPAVAESTGIMGTQVEWDLHPDIQPPTSLLDVPHQRMSLDDRSQTDCRPDRATDQPDESEIEYPTCITHSLDALPLSREDETENGRTSLPAQQSTSPHGEQILATLQHPPEAESMDIIGMVTADDLQPSTSMLDQTAEAEQAGMLGTTADWDLWPEMQSSTTTQDVPSERTAPSGMPVMQSTTALLNAEPSCDPHAEPAGTLCMVAAADLRSEMQPSSSVQDQPAEAERAGTLGTMAAQDLQPETQQSSSDQHMSPEITHRDGSIQVGLQTNTTLGPGQLTQLFPVPPAAFNNLLCSPEPLKNELERLNCCKILLSQTHEQKKSLLRTEYSQELEKIKKKYELLLQKEDSTYHRLTMELDVIYRSVSLHQSLAENFRERFMKSSAAQDRSATLSPTIWQVPQSSQQAPARTSAAQTTTSPVASSLAARAPALTSFHSTGHFLQPSQVAQPSAYEAIQLQSMLHGNLYRTPSPPLGSMPVQNGSYVAAGAQSREHVPLLQQLRMPPPYAAVRRDQQQRPVISPGIASLRRSAPGMSESFAPRSLLAGVPLTSTASSSVHQAMPSASNSHPALPASSLLSGSPSEFFANFVRSSSTNPVPMATQQVSSMTPAFDNMSGPLNAAAETWQAGAHVAGTEPASEALLFQRWWHHTMAGAVLTTSVASGSVHQTMAAAPNPHPPLPASSAHPILTATQQASSPNPVLHNMSGPLNAAAPAGVWQGRANQSVPESAWFNAWLAGRTGLSGGPAGTGAQGGANVEVVCLSDDEG